MISEDDQSAVATAAPPRARSLVARLLAAVLPLLLVGCGATPGLQVQRSGGRSRSALVPATRTPAECRGGGEAQPLGHVAYVHQGALELLLLATCQTRPITLVAHGVEGPVRFSSDGRWVAYGDGTVVSVQRREIVRPFGQKVLTWSWVGHSDELIGITEGGGLIAGAPGVPPRRLLPDGWNATSVATASDGQIAVSRATPHPGGRVSGSASIWTLTLSRPRPALDYSAPAGTAELKLARFAPGGKDVVFWVNRWGSASLAEDGLPLQILPLRGDGSTDRGALPVTLSTNTPTRPEAVATCGARLVFVVGGGREATLDKHLESTDRQEGWQAEDITDGRRSVISPSCALGGRMLAAAIGPNRRWHPGAEDRAIEAFAGKRTRLSTPSPGSSDESPRFTGNGRWVLFIRSEYGDRGARGFGYLVATRGGGGGGGGGGGDRPIGPLFTAGPASDYYGAYDWGEMVALLPAAGG